MKITWLLSYTDRAGVKGMPIYLSSEDPSGGGWEIEIVSSRGGDDCRPKTQQQNHEVEGM